MAAKVREAKASDFEATLRLASEVFGHQAGSVGAQRLENIMRHIFAKSYAPNFEASIGYVLENDGQIVGFLGCIESSRILNGVETKVCNLSTWVVAEAQRKNSLLLLMPLRKKKDYLITNLTPTATAFELFKRLVKLQPLETSFYLVPFFRPFILPSRAKIVNELAQLKKRLDGAEKRILEDHIPYRAFHLLLSHKEEHCYVIYRIVHKKKLKFVQLDYIGNPTLFNKHYGKLHRYLFFKHFAMGVLIDSRMIDKKISGSLQMQHPVTKMSNAIAENPINDNLYSEYFFT